MRHFLTTIAATHRLDELAFLDFARIPGNMKDFGIFIESGALCTTTWYTNELIDAFKKSVMGSKHRTPELGIKYLLNSFHDISYMEGAKKDAELKKYRVCGLYTEVDMVEVDRKHNDGKVAGVCAVLSEEGYDYYLHRSIITFQSFTRIS